MDYQFLKYAVKAHVATITLNRPKSLNAINAGMLTELMGAVSQAQIDAAVRVVIITGAGKAFCAGADIKEMAGRTPVQIRDYTRQGQEIFTFIESMDTPIIAAVNGYAFGGGCELALCATFRMATPTAQFALPEITLGILPGWGGTQRLTATIGKSRALEMMLTGEPITGKEAYRIGLVNHLSPSGELLKSAQAIGRKIAANAPIAAKFILNAVRVGRDSSIEGGLQLEAAFSGLLGTTQDRMEGITAFLEKRRAKFTGA